MSIPQRHPVLCSWHSRGSRSRRPGPVRFSESHCRSIPVTCRRLLERASRLSAQHVEPLCLLEPVTLSYEFGLAVLMSGDISRAGMTVSGSVLTLSSGASLIAPRHCVLQMVLHGWNDPVRRAVTNGRQ